MAGTRTERTYHQDYIARIRYSNTLPPPPNPPKLLDIPGTGLAGGQYTSAAFASRLAREQPLNIEADAELGMPIDLVGLPGVFDGDERAIMARNPAPPIHPHDRALLKPLSALGKPTTMNAGVSFLRRTEYISSSQGGQRFESSTSKDLLRVRNDSKRKKPVAKKNDPISIMRALIKGFDLAYPDDTYTGEDSTTNLRGDESTAEEKRAWKNPKHPTKPHLELLDSYPLLPDLDALPSNEAYQVTKFSVNPTGTTDGYDSRLDVAILRPGNADLEQYEDRIQARIEDPSLPKPMPEYDYDLFLPPTASAVKGIKRKLDVNDPDHDSEFLYERHNEHGAHFPFAFVREYETYQQAGDPDEPYGDTVALAIHDPDLVVGAVEGTNKRLGKGAYYYPIKARTNLRPKRKAARREDGSHADMLIVKTRQPDKYESYDRATAQHKLDPSLQVPKEPTPIPDQTQDETHGQIEGQAVGEAEGDADADDDADADADDAEE